MYWMSLLKINTDKPIYSFIVKITWLTCLLFLFCLSFCFERRPCSVQRRSCLILACHCLNHTVSLSKTSTSSLPHCRKQKSKYTWLGMAPTQPFSVSMFICVFYNFTLDAWISLLSLHVHTHL